MVVFLAFGASVLAARATAQDAGLAVSGAVRFPDGSLQTTALSGVAPLADSGQTTCWDAAGASRTCAGTGEDGEYQAGISVVSPHFSDNGDGTVTDNQTGLMWLKDADCGWGTVTWQGALDTAADFNVGSAGGDCAEYDDIATPYTDWRLPGLLELRSLVHFGAFNPALDPLHQFLDVSTGEHWTSTTYAGFPGAAWTLSLSQGLNLSSNKNNPRALWLVRGEPVAPAPANSVAALVLSGNGLRLADGRIQLSAAVDTAPLRGSGWTTCVNASGIERNCTGTGEDGELRYGVAPPTPRFADRGDGTVLDQWSGLVWLMDADCPAANITWQDALDWIEDLNTMPIACANYPAGSYSDWRLPNASELLSLNDLTASEPALTVGHPFLNVHGGIDEHYWSSTTTLLNKAQSLATDMSDGLQRPKTKTDATCCWAWPVRGGR